MEGKTVLSQAGGSFLPPIIPPRTPHAAPAGNHPSEEEVDEIMEKISRSGLSSLTEEEREVLRRASRR